eukprot:4702391-Pyramimonas_sp.AAC.1
MPNGVAFLFPSATAGKTMEKRMAPEVQRDLTRLRVNAGRASPGDLARLAAKAGGPEVAVAGARAL